MKKLSLLFFALAISLTARANHYSFSVVAPSGQMLYYTIVSGGVKVTYPLELNNKHGWDLYSPIVGDVVIPDTVYWNGTYYLVVAVDDYAFSKCNVITSCIIPNTCKTLGKYCFYRCRRLKSVILGKNLTTIGDYAFEDCDSLKQQIVLPDKVANLGISCFEKCSGITSFTASPALTAIPNSCFGGCSELKKVILTNRLQSIGEKAFYSCRKIASIDVPSSVKTIGEKAFLNIPNVSYKGTASGSPWGALCMNAYYDDSVYYNASVKTAVVSVDRFTVHAYIPASVTSFGYFALFGCDDMKTLKMESSQPPVLQGGDAYITANDLTIIVPCDAVEVYRNDDVWKNYNITCEGGGNNPDPDPGDSTHIENIITTNITVSSQREGVLIGNANGENIDIFDVYGRTIYRKKIHGTELIPLQTGFYIVRINGILCRKIVVMR